MPDRSSLTRRAVLLGGVAAVAGCSAGGVDTSEPGPPATTTLAVPQTPLTSGSGRPPWSQLRRAVDGRLLLPRDAAYDQARLLENPRHDGQRPLAVLTVATADDVGTAFAFAQDHDLPVAIRSGGHSYPGWSGGGDPRALVIDCRGLDAVDLGDDNNATVGPGASLIEVYDAVGSSGRAIGAGSCPTVGFGGLTLGGGVGVLTGAFGLTCDQVTSMQVVTADGAQRTVSAESEPDLFFALRGGGGGHGALVASFTLSTRVAPQVSTAYLQWPLSAAPDVVAAWQGWTRGAPSEQWSTLKCLAGQARSGGPVVLVSATWVGEPAAFARRLDALRSTTPAPAADSTNSRTYLETMRSFAGCADLDVAACSTGPGGALDREAFTATSHVAYDPLDDAGISDLLQQVEGLQDSGLKEAGASIDALGGRVAEVAADETAFVHREALATVQYTATYNGDDPQPAQDAVRALRSVMTPHWGEHAYVNYADADLPDPEQAYFGANAARLADVARTYDPDGFFTQPQGW